jgi:hypothetical protein
MPQISHKRELLSSGYTLQFGREFIAENAQCWGDFSRLDGVGFLASDLGHIASVKYRIPMPERIASE